MGNTNARRRCRNWEAAWKTTELGRIEVAVTVDLVPMLSRVIRTSIPQGCFIYGEFSMQRKTTGKGELGELQNEIQTKTAAAEMPVWLH